MPIERFGYNEKRITEQQWIQIGNKMKTSPFVRLRDLKFIAQADHQSQRFKNIALLTGSVLFLAFLKFPMIRVQPGFRRVGLSGVLAYPCYAYMCKIADRFKVKQIKHAYRKSGLKHKAHPKITI